MRQPANAAPTRLWESRYFLAQAVARLYPTEGS